MKTDKIRTALHTWNDLLKTTEAGREVAAAFEQLDAVEKVLDRVALNKADERAALRDTFAAAALTGILANQNTQGLLPHQKDALALGARIAFGMADAMLAAREGKT